MPEQIKKCACGANMVKAEWKNQWVCYRCGQTSPIHSAQTNGDKFRTQIASDEALAEFLSSVVPVLECPRTVWDAVEKGGVTYKDAWFKYLGQPAEEE